MKNRPYGFAFGALLALSVVMLSAQVGGFPSRPRFQAVGIGKAAPAAGNMDILVNANTAQTLGVDNDSNGTANLSRVAISSGDVNLAVFATGSGRSTAAITNGPTGAQAGLRTLGAHPIVFGTSNTLAATISSAQVFDFVNSPTVNSVPIATDSRDCKVKSSDTTVASNITPAADLALSNWVTTVSTTYIIDAVLIISGGSAIDFRFQLESTGTPVSPLAVGVINTMPTQSTASAVGYESLTVLNENNADLKTGASGGLNVVRLTGPYTTSSSGTDFDFEWSQVTSNASASTLRAGSYMCLTPLAAM